MEKKMSKSQNEKKNRLGLTISIMCIIATALILVYIIVALLLAPKTSVPEFDITDQNGEWKAQGEIAVFDEKINPGSEGEYKFILKNRSDVKLKYEFKLSEHIGNVNRDFNPFMQYRLKVDNIPIDNQWHYAGLDYSEIEILPVSKHLVTLEWRWPFEGEKDSNDTLVGRTEDQLSVWLFLQAEVVDD